MNNNLTELQKQLQQNIRRTGKNEPMLSDELEFRALWDSAVAELQGMGYNVHQAGRKLHEVCEAARNETR